MEERGKNLIFLGWALVVGALTGLIGSIFQLGIKWIEGGRHHFIHFLAVAHIPAWLVATVSSALMVMLAAFLVHRFAPEASGSGVQEIEGALIDKRPVRWKRILPVKFVSGLLSLGAGLVMGREGPTIQMGGALGKMIAVFTKMSSKHSKILLCAGAGAGLATAFNAPIAGILFVLEELREGFCNNFIGVKAVIVACVAADIVLRIFMGSGPDILVKAFALPPMHNYIFFIVFGFVVGFAALAFNLGLMGVLRVYDNLQKRIHYLILAGFVGGVIGLLTVLFPQVTGGGYSIIEKALHLNLPLMFLLLLFVCRFGTTLMSYPTGVPGGIFAPMLALGTLLGLAFGKSCVGLFPDAHLVIGVFAVAGMGAFFAASVRAPITGVVLIVEMTQNYLLIIPILITCIIATMVVVQMGNLPIYTQLLERTLKKQEEQELTAT